MIGDYHKQEDTVYIPRKDSKAIIDSYLRKDGDYSFCVLCEFSSKESRAIRNHLLEKHLKINIFKCQECGVEMKLEAEIKQHMKLEHDLEYEGLEKLVDPEYETTETEVPVEDISLVAIDDLRGKKVSSAQARSLRKMHVSRNGAESVFECQLCGEKKDFLSAVSDHVMSQHFDVYIYQCKTCGKLLRNWKSYSRHRESKTKLKEVKPIVRGRLRQGDDNINLQHHLLEKDLYVGHDEGMRIVRNT